MSTYIGIYKSIAAIEIFTMIQILGCFKEAFSAVSATLPALFLVGPLARQA